MKLIWLLVVFLIPGVLKKQGAEPGTERFCKEYKDEIYQRYKEVPVLCYHNIKDTSAKEDLLWIGKSEFEEQLRSLHDSGYHTILPEQLYQYLTTGAALPAKPVMLTFDDSHEGHFSIARPILDRYGFKGAFFITTAYIGKKNYLTADQIKELSDKGHAIAAHTYDHPFITTLKGKQWDKQIDIPKQKLEKITGLKIEYFAYPYGVWNEEAINELKGRGIKAAFRLYGKKSETESLFTIRRLMVSGGLSGIDLERHMKTYFH